MNLRRISVTMAFVLACGAPLQSLAAFAPMPCHESSSHHDADMHEPAPAHHHERKASHACAMCAACCAGAAISYCTQLTMDASASGPVASSESAPLSGPAPARLDRPPQLPSR